jgi:hypothetical protein
VVELKRVPIDDLPAINNDRGLSGAAGLTRAGPPFSPHIASRRPLRISYSDFASAADDATSK